MKFGWRGALGLVLSVLLLWWTLHDVAWGDVWRELRASNLPLFLAAATCATLIFPLRAIRWRVILAPVAPRVPLGMLWRATAIGMMVNNVVPARAGEIARAYALTRETPRVSFAAAFASIALDRVFDAVVLLLLLCVAMLDPRFPGGAVIGGRPVAQWVGSWGTLAMLAVFAGFYVFVLFPQRIVRVFEWFARRVAPSVEARGREMILTFAAGLGVLRHPGRFAAVFGWTVAHWLVHGLAFWLGFKAVGITAPYTAALFLQGLIALGVAVPSSPGFFGLFEALAKTGLSEVYRVPAALAVSWAIGYHILAFIPITLIGAVYFVRMGLHFRDVGDAEREGGGARPGAEPPQHAA